MPQKKEPRKPSFTHAESVPIPELEEKILAYWKEHHIFEKTLEATKKKKPFTFYDGPPFATGLPHYGHILASTIKDLIPRYQTMRGRYVRRRWGWDCHGLPIEEIVERKLGISGKKQIEEIGIEKFNETCRSVVLQFASDWEKMVDRVARWTEFKNSYKTMDRDYMESVWWAFKEIHKKGLVYEGRKVLLYCPRCETPISNFEVAMDNSYEDVTEEAVTIKFKVKKLKTKIDGPVYLLAWTTTPWTLPGNVALAVGTDIQYVIAERGNERVIVAKDLAGKILGEHAKVLQEVKGKDLVGLEYEPLFDVPAVKSEKAFHVYAADFVTTDEGTGIVHTAVVYGEEDYELGMKVGLPVVPLLDEKGKFNDKAPKLIRGTYFKEAEKAIKDDLNARGLLFARASHKHSYPHCWRCGNMLFYNAIPAWFVNIGKMRKGLLASNKKEINWFPAHLKTGRYQKSVEAAPDWNISRNRYWGNPIPVWKCEKCGTAEAVGSLEELAKKAGKAKNRYFVMRHGQAENNVKNLIDSGGKSYPLTKLGRAQIEKSVKALAKKGKIDMIIASDIFRTAETASLAGKVLGIEKIVFDPHLREIDLGVLSGCHDRKYHEMFPTYGERFEKAPENGETLRDLRKRLYRFFEETEKKYEGKTILIVSHEYPIWMMHHLALGLSEAQAIAEKEKRGKDFVKTAEITELPYLTLPRKDDGLVDLHRPYIDAVTLACGSCGGKAKRITEIFDSWVEAGSMPFAEHHYPFENQKTFKERFPAQFIAEYIAQTRAWFYVMHVVSYALFKTSPFENAVTTGTILAEDGSKMSKSKMNYPDPWVVLGKYGADALRLYLMGSVVMQADNLNFSTRDLETVYRKNIVILSNVLNFYKTYAKPGANISNTEPRTSNVLDRWILARTEELGADITKCLDGYDTVRAARAIEKYIDDLSTWYLRRSRRRLQRPESAKDFAAASATLGFALGESAKLMAPFTPYLSEFVYQSVTGAKRKESVHLEPWPKVSSRITRNASLITSMNEIRRLASAALAKRAEAGIKVRQPLSELRVKGNGSKAKLPKELLEILKDEVNVKKVVFSPKLQNEVEFDTVITPELKAEGILRDVVRLVQGLRQEADLKPQDKIVLMMDLPAYIADLMKKEENVLKAEVGAKEVQYKKSDKFTAEIVTTMDGMPAWAAVRKI